MTDVVSLSHAQRANLNLLLLLRDAAKHDLGGAICSFGVCRAELSALARLDPDEILSFVCGMGDQALFYPRTDLTALLDMAPPVAAAIAASRNARQ